MYESAEWLKDYGIKRKWMEEKLKVIDHCDKEDYFEGVEELAEDLNPQLESTGETPAP